MSDSIPDVDLAPLLRGAQRGLRSAVAPLVEALDSALLLVPLAKPIDGVPLGEQVQPEDGEITMVPHLLPVPGETGAFVPLFSDADVLTTLGAHLDWKTDGDELQYCTLPARTALDLAQQLIDDEQVLGAVINAADDTELVLLRHELGAFTQGTAIPLVGYVQAIDVGPDEQVLVAQSDRPPNPALVAAIEGCLKQFDSVLGYELQQTFNPERDLEPHPSVTIRIASDVALDRDELSRRLFEAAEGKLGNPGYMDVMFDTQANSQP